MTVAPEVRASRSDAETARIPTGAPKRTRHPAVDDKPVEFWPTAAIREALETDDLTVWQRIVTAIKRDPYAGPRAKSRRCWSRHGRMGFPRHCPKC